LTAGETVSSLTTSRDLRTLVDAKLAIHSRWQVSYVPALS
jgi:hypothetical protein